MRLRRAAGRADRHRVDRHPGDHRDRQDRRAPARLPAHPGLQPAGEQPAAARGLRAATGKSHYPQRRAEMRQNFAAGVPAGPAVRIGLRLHPRGTRTQILEQAWEQRNGLLFLRTFTDTMRTLEANEIVAEFVRGKIRQIVKDPDVAELLCPKTYPIGTKRICMDTGYFETFNRPNVTLVDVRANPITEITPAGLRTTRGALRPRHPCPGHRLRRGDRIPDADEHHRPRRGRPAREVGPAAQRTTWASWWRASRTCS